MVRGNVMCMFAPGGERNDRVITTHDIRPGTEGLGNFPYHACRGDTRVKGGHSIIDYRPPILRDRWVMPVCRVRQVSTKCRYYYCTRRFHHVHQRLNDGY